MIEERYILLIHKQFRKEISKAEQSDLQEWIKQDPKHQLLVEDMARTWQLSQDYQSSFVPDVDEGLKNLRQRIAADKKGEKQTVAKVRSLPRRLAVAASILLLIAALASWNFWPTQSPLLTATTGPGEKLNVELSDGSTVIVNENSEFRYPESFQEGARQVFLSGEAYFDIATVENQSFQVHTAKTQTEVLGTGFNVRSYDFEPYTEVEVREGIVNLKATEANNKGSLQLKQGDRGTFKHSSLKPELVHSRPKTLNASYWKDGYLRFQGHSIAEAIKEIEDRLDLQIEFRNTTIQNCVFTTTVPIDDLDSLGSFIAKPNGATWTKLKERHYIIEGGICPESN